MGYIWGSRMSSDEEDDKKKKKGSGGPWLPPEYHKDEVDEATEGLFPKSKKKKKKKRKRNRKYY